MIHMTVEDFIEEIKAELVCYEEIEETEVMAWEKKFLQLLNDNKLSSLKIKKENGKKTIELKDETDIFQMADGYFAAIEFDDRDAYWEGLCAQ